VNKKKPDPRSEVRQQLLKFAELAYNHYKRAREDLDENVAELQERPKLSYDMKGVWYGVASQVAVLTMEHIVADVKNRLEDHMTAIDTELFEGLPDKPKKSAKKAKKR